MIVLGWRAVGARPGVPTLARRPGRAWRTWKAPPCWRRRINPLFGTNGVVTTGVRGSGNDQAAVVSILPSGKILAAGDTAYSQFSNVLSLARYNANGTLDTSFGVGGRVLADFFPGAFQELTTVTGLAVQPDGKYVVAATAAGYDVNFNWVSQIALVRYLPNGSLDTSFGSGGVVLSNAFETTYTDGTPLSDGAHGVALQPDGHIVVSGSVFEPDAGGQWRSVVALAYFNRAGGLDTSFGTQGVVTTTLAAQNAGGNDIAGLPDGSVVVAATSVSDAYEIGSYNVLAYDPHGSLYPWFGNHGVATSTISNAPAGTYGNDGFNDINRVGHIAVGPLGTIDVTGVSYTSTTDGLSQASYAVVQFTPGARSTRCSAVRGRGSPHPVGLRGVRPERGPDRAGRRLDRGDRHGGQLRAVRDAVDRPRTFR